MGIRKLNIILDQFVSLLQKYIEVSKYYRKARELRVKWLNTSGVQKKRKIYTTMNLFIIILHTRVPFVFAHLHCYTGFHLFTSSFLTHTLSFQINLKTEKSNSSCMHYTFLVILSSRFLLDKPESLGRVAGTCTVKSR